jgi:catalase
MLSRQLLQPISLMGLAIRQIRCYKLVCCRTDAQRYRLGTNYEQIPVNRCPFATNNYQRDGQMRTDGNGGENPNYFPNSFDDIQIDQAYKEPPF